MSDHIPFELQVEVIKKLPIKSLMQFRSVSKTWKAQIDSSDFITTYNNQRQHLLVSSRVVFDRKYVSLVDDDTFPQQKVSLTLPPSVVDLAKHSYIVGSSHGLICLYSHDFSGKCSGKAVIWNPSIRKAVCVVVPNPENKNNRFTPYLGFGVCRVTTDPKIVKITNRDKIVEVFALSEGVWRRPYNSLPPFKSIVSALVVIEGVLYWVATSSTSDIHCYRLIISFDITSEEFREVNLPDSLAQSDRVKISQLKGSLVVLEHFNDDMCFDVWMMEDGVPNSFTKLYTICTPDVYERVFSGVLSVLAFRKSGEAIIEIIDYRREQKLEDSSDEEDPTTVVYDPYSKQIDDLGIVGNLDDFGGYPYIETLLLLDQPDYVIYDQGKRYVSKRRAKKRRILKHKGKGVFSVIPTEVGG